MEGNAAEPLFNPVPEPIDEASAPGVQTQGWYEMDAAAPSSSAMRRTTIVVAITALVVAVLAVAGCGGSTAAGSPHSAAGSCEEVTSYDYNWDNDMKCTRSDGSTFYTDYTGAERFETHGDE